MDQLTGLFRNKHTTIGKKGKSRGICSSSIISSAVNGGLSKLLTSFSACCAQEMFNEAKAINIIEILFFIIQR